MMQARWYLTEGGSILVEDNLVATEKALVTICDADDAPIMKIQMDRDVVKWLHHVVDESIARSSADRGDLTESEYKIYKKLKDKLDSKLERRF